MSYIIIAIFTMYNSVIYYFNKIILEPLYNYYNTYILYKMFNNIKHKLVKISSNENFINILDNIIEIIKFENMIILKTDFTETLRVYDKIKEEIINAEPCDYSIIESELIIEIYKKFVNDIKSNNKLDYNISISHIMLYFRSILENTKKLLKEEEYKDLIIEFSKIIDYNTDYIRNVYKHSKNN
ncbi:hypothetical protein AHEV_215 [Adoxophyes honmai entomopoxvirus 'L']|uniref:Uncharacterized protein n=1 Tax=Adoxophyes honmai entomopoxvirus 'L' TaxID=1293540 RepID=A0A916KP96_9POXV|nr:hypothetical protein AHEV_215 [Adoxophyes honmai entomopoxvirus 'L']CCU55536.1 hypothetical protein AHEV_215 [Adoxophyes honmai entomopoxvirus 'L']